MLSVNRRQFLVSSLGAAGWRAAAASAKGPNILFLFADDQRFNTLHALDNPEVKTPNLDGLVRRGISFTDTYIMGGTIGAICAPSRAMLMTGQHLFHVHDSIIQPNQDPGRPRKPFDLFPEQLRRHGYMTYGIGKWHNGPALFNRCFEGGENIFFGGMSDHLKVPVQSYDPSGAYPKSRIHPGEKFSSELFSDSAIRFLQNYKDSRPFFLYVAYTAPHDPRMAPAEYAAMYPPAKITLPKNFLPEHPFDNGELKVRDEMLAPFPRTPEVIRQHIAAYFAMITHLDAHIGRVLKTLSETGHDQDTIIVFAADNGLAVGQHGLMGKQNLYDHSVRVPLVISMPGGARGKRVNTMCYLHDLAPTLLELAGVTPPATMESRSLKPVLEGKTTAGRDSIFFAYRNLQRGVRTRDWKLIIYNVNGKVTRQLFDMKNDPLEMHNLAERPEHAKRVAELTALLKRWMKETDDPHTLLS